MLLAVPIEVDFDPERAAERAQIAALLQRHG